VARRAAWTLAWWILLFWLWLAFVGEWNPTEWIAAALAGAGAAVVSLVVLERGELRCRLRIRWLRETARIPVQILVDVGLLAVALVRPSVGRFVARPTGTRGAEAESAGRRAFLELAAGYSPNAYVVDVDPETG